MRDFSKLLGIISLAFFIGGCNLEKIKEESTPYNGVIKVNVTPQMAESMPDSLAIQIKNGAAQLVSNYTKLAEMPSEGVSLPVGDYEVLATPTNRKIPQFNRPLYAGVSTFKITSNSASSVNLTLKQSNFSVGITYSDKFKTENSNYSTKISSPEGALTYVGTETRLGYFHSGPLTIAITYTDSKGAIQTVQKTVEATSPNIAPASNLMLNVKLANESTTTGNTTGNLTGYYQNASGKTGVEIKKALTTIISTGYTERTYNELWDAYKVGDIKKDGTGVIWDVYSDNPEGTPTYLFQPGQNQCGSYTKEGDCYNREHTIPKSWFNEDAPMLSDYLHILPTDGYVNGRRSNYPYGEVATATWTSKNGSKLGSCKSTLGYSHTVFEPIDAYKGDIARIYFYFVTRYADRLTTYDNKGTTEEVFNVSDYGLDKWVVDMFLRWSKNDPVSQKEINRNIQAEKFQKNRNPYVDHPEFIDMIWGNTTTKSITKKAGVTYLDIKVK